MRLRLPRPRFHDPASDVWTEPGPETELDGTVDALEAFAAGPLSPDEATLARMKSHLRAAVAQSAAVGREAARRPRWAYRRRLFAATASIAVMLLAAGGVAAAESGPGEPFYRTRLDVEALFLPPAGSDARLTADVDRAQARLDEAQRAAASGNWNAEADALGAYSDVVGSMALTGSPGNRETAQTRLRAQLQRLVGLESGAEGDTPARLRRAIGQVDALLGTTPETPATPGPSAVPTPPATGSPDHGPTQGPGGNGGGNASPSPEGPGGDAGSSGSNGPGASPSARPTGIGPDGSAGNGQGGKPGDQSRGG